MTLVKRNAIWWIDITQEKEYPKAQGCTGLRESNVTHLKWKDVDLKRKHTLVHPDESKTKKAIPFKKNL